MQKIEKLQGQERLKKFQERKTNILSPKRITIKQNNYKFKDLINDTTPCKKDQMIIKTWDVYNFKD